MTNKIPAILILLIAIVEIAIVVIGLSNGAIAPGGTVPVLNMDSSMTYIIFWVAFPIAGSILAILLIPRILTPVFMLVKKLLSRGFNDGYVDIPSSGFGGRKMFMRLIYVYLFIVGLLTTLMGIFDSQTFLAVDVYADQLAHFLDPSYHISYLFCLTGIAVPLSVALWSVGWALEDAGLLQYKLPPKEENKLYEIEPVYKSYSSYLKGFAGFSAILALVVIFNHFMAIGKAVDAVSAFLVPLHGIFVMIPAYFLFAILGSNWLRKNKRVIKQLEEGDLNLYAD